MSDDEADPELLELLRQSLGISQQSRDKISSDTGVLKDAEYIYDNAIDVSIDMYGTKAAAANIYAAIKERGYSTQAWGQHELHPTHEQGFSDVDIVNFVFTMDLLNFSFWSDLPESERFQVEYQGKRWTGYKSLLACLHRALDEGILITTPRFWNDQSCSDERLRHVFRSATDEEMPLLLQRIKLLREAGKVLTESFGDTDSELDSHQSELFRSPEVIEAKLQETELPLEHNVGPVPAIEKASQIEHGDGESESVARTDLGHALKPGGNESEINEPLCAAPDIEPGGNVLPTISAVGIELPSSVKLLPKPDLSVIRLIEKAEHSAGKLVNILVKYIPSFRDEARFNGRKVKFYKRAQIFVADLWAAFDGAGYGKFDDIDHLTMFADYRVPQMLHSLGVLVYSPPLEYAIRDKRDIISGGNWEVQLRGCSIWAVELIRREIMRLQADAAGVNAVLIDFLLYDLAKEREDPASFPHHHTRTIFY